MKNLLTITALSFLSACGMKEAGASGKVTGRDLFTGTYELDESKTDANGDFFGYKGTIYVKKAGKEKIDMGFSIVKGAPSYNSGSFNETLKLEGNKATYRYESCEVIFTFYGDSITVREDDKNSSGCGFGHGVYAHGTYYRTSSEEPDVRNPMMR